MSRSRAQRSPAGWERTSGWNVPKSWGNRDQRPCGIICCRPSVRVLLHLSRGATLELLPDSKCGSFVGINFRLCVHLLCVQKMISLILTHYLILEKMRATNEECVCITITWCTRIIDTHVWWRNCEHQIRGVRSTITWCTRVIDTQT